MYKQRTNLIRKGQCMLAQACMLFLFLTLAVTTSAQDYTEISSRDYSYVPLEWFAYEPKVNDIYEESISIVVDDASFHEVLQKIQTKTGTRLAYDVDILPKERLSLSFDEVKVVDLFASLTSGHEIEAYASAHGHIVLRPKTKEPAETEMVQPVTVTGVVRDAVQGEVLPGVNVVVKGTRTGDVTGMDGTYSVRVPSLQDTLIFSYLGYETVEEPINDREEVHIFMNESGLIGDEIVVVGYGDVRRRDLTGSVSSVSSQELQVSRSGLFERALQGQAAGVMVVSNTGQPGGGTSVRIRGTNTLTGGAEPLYVIDGVPMSGESSNSTNPLATLNPSDIESIDVLKDASAAAIYGARAANGVILVTTKRGVAGQTHVDYSGSIGFQQLPGKMDVMNLREYAEYRNRQAEIVGFGQRQEFLDPSILGSGTNWQDELFRSAPMHEHNLSISGGDQITRYRLSFGYFDQEGIALGSEFQRYSVRLNLDNSPTPWLDIGTSLNVSRTEEKITVSDADLVNIAIRQAPDIPVRASDGSWGGPSESEFTLVNPVAMAQIVDNNQERAEVHGNLYASINLHRSLSVRTEFSGMYSYADQAEFTPTYEFNQRINEINSASNSKSTSQYWQGRVYANYSQWFADVLRLNAMAGYEAEVFEFNGLQGGRRFFPGNNVKILAAGDAETMTNNGWAGSNSMQSVFSRLNLDYDNRYLLTGTLRVDGSSRFGPDNRWGVFPSFAGAWRVSSEPFFALNFVDEMKFRVGYGFVGNQEIGNYLYGSALLITATAWGSGVRPANIPNPDLKWESTESINVGTDLTMFNERISITFDAYKKWTRDLLLRQPLPLYSGTSGIASIGAPMVNIGSLENRGIELALNTINIEGPLRWESRVVFTRNRNEVTAMDQETSFIERNIDFFDPVSRTIVGQPVGTFYGYVVEGVFTDADDIRNHATQHNNISATNGVWPGDLKFKDLNGDGVIDENDRTIIGDPNPDFQFGITNTFYYRNLDFQIFLNGSYGNDVFNQLKRINEDPSSNFGLLSSVNDHARLELRDPDGDPNDVENVYVSNPSTAVPRITASDPNNNSRISDRYVEDGSYLRIQNITIGYQLPPDLLDRWGIRTMRVYASVQNLYTFTKYSGFDPEVGAQMDNPDPLLIGVDRGRYPSPRIFSFGLNLGI
ncbi:TonB-dependent receptor [Balneolaceae bacterium ANBcel3]|nr:TonB-dependent receptor [Balneolaceae bacterium ANBcel3]